MQAGSSGGTLPGGDLSGEEVPGEDTSAGDLRQEEKSEEFGDIPEKWKIPEASEAATAGGRAVQGDVGDTDAGAAWSRRKADKSHTENFPDLSVEKMHHVGIMAM